MEFSDLYPFTSHYHRIGGNRLHFLDEGRGGAVLMLHGNPTWSFFYRDLVRALADDCRCIVPDHLGMGLSDKPQDYDYHLAAHIANLDSLVTSLGVGKLTLVLHDWGGAIGMGWAVQHPEQVERIVILNTAAFTSDRIPLRIKICRIPFFGALSVRGLNGFALAATFMTTCRPLAPEVRAGFVRPYDSWANRVAILRFVQDIPMNPGHRTWPVIKEIESKLKLFAKTPVMIEWGAGDWCFTEAYCRTWQQFFPHARVNLYPDAAHYLLEDKGNEIIPRVRQFINNKQLNDE